VRGCVGVGVWCGCVAVWLCGWDKLTVVAEMFQHALNPVAELMDWQRSKAPAFSASAVLTDPSRKMTA
jgi:hypothetical protein